MKTLTLLRHAKSSWDDPVTRDFDRPLNAKGRRAAAIVGNYMRDQKLRFDQILASPAVRVAETLDAVALGYQAKLSADWDRRIYLASSVTLIDVLRGADPATQHVLMAGHNPGLEDLIFDLVLDDGRSPLRELVEEKFPTTSLATLTLDISAWTDISDGCATLDNFIRPRDLDATLGPDAD